MFIFYFLGARRPCRSIFCQFWLCEEAQCVYLRHHLGSPPTDALYHIEKVLFFFKFVENFYYELAFVRGFSASTEMIVWFLFFFFF